MTKIRVLFILSSFFISCMSMLSEEELVVSVQENYKKENWLKVIEFSNILTDKYPTNIQGFVARATALVKLDSSHDQVLSDLDHVLNLEPLNNYARFLRFQSYLRKDDCALALSEVDTLIKLNGQTPYLLTAKGIAAFSCKKFKVAEESLKMRLDKSGSYEEMKFAYYYWVYSKYFGGNKDGAMWDCAFLPNRGFERDTVLMRNIAEDNLSWEALMNFNTVSRTMSEIESKITYVP